MKILLCVLFGALPLAIAQPSPEKTETVAPATFEIRALSGVTYKNCRIVKSTPAYITVAHDNGVARIKFENLSRSWQQKFGYDPSKAASYSLAESNLKQKTEADYKALVTAHAKDEELRLLGLANQERLSSLLLPALAPLPGDSLVLAPVEAQVNVVPESPTLGQPYTPGQGYGRNSNSWSNAYPLINSYSTGPVWYSPQSCPQTYYTSPGYNGHYHQHPQIFMGPPMIRITR